MIQYVIVDIASPPHTWHSLSQLRIRLLRDFDKMFMRAHDAELLEEDVRLEGLNETTREWWRKMAEGKRK